MNTYVFRLRNPKSGDIKHMVATHLDDAYALCGVHKYGPEPWLPWECWLGNECLWHFLENGRCEPGAREQETKPPKPDGVKLLMDFMGAYEDLLYIGSKPTDDWDQIQCAYDTAYAALLTVLSKKD